MPREKKITPLERLNQRAAETAAKLTKLQERARTLTAMDQVQTVPEYNRLLAEKAALRHTLHMIRVNIAKKKQAITHRQRDLENFQKALQAAEESEVAKMAEQSAVDTRMQQLIERHKARVKP